MYWLLEKFYLHKLYQICKSSETFKCRKKKTIDIWKIICWCQYEKDGKEIKALHCSLQKRLGCSSFSSLFFVTPFLWFRFIYSNYMKYCTGNRSSPPLLFFLQSFLTWQMPFPDACLSYLVHNVLWRTWIKPKSSSVCFRNVRPHSQVVPQAVFASQFLFPVHISLYIHYVHKGKCHLPSAII